MTSTNTAIGMSAKQTNTTGFQNTAVGVFALTKPTDSISIGSASKKTSANIRWDWLGDITYGDDNCSVSIECNCNSYDTVGVAALFKEITQMKKQMSQMLDTIRDLQDENNLLKDYVSLMEPVKSAEKK